MPLRIPLGRWAIESADARCLIVSLATPDGFEVAFAVPFAESRDLGKALKREGTAAARSDGVEAPWTKPKCRALN